MNEAGALAARVLHLAQRIQQIPAPTFGEQIRAEFVESLFRTEGLADVGRDEPGNVYGRVRGREGGGCMVVSAHLDTVFPAEADLTLRFEPGRILGPGLGDNSLGVAGLLGLAWGISGGSLPAGDVWLVANVAEEGLGNLRGMRAVVERFGSAPKAYVVLEGMAFGKVYHRSLGVERLRIECRTPGGHSWVDHGIPSAVHELAALVQAITAIPLSTEPRTTMNVGRISGGTSVNTIASEAGMDLDLRSEAAGALAGLVEGVRGCVAAATRPDVEFSVANIGSRPAGGIDPDHPLVALAAEGLRRVGEAPEISVGSTDANIPHSRGLPAVCIGLTHGGGAHTHNEYIAIDPLARGLTQLIWLVGEALRLA
jgi:acetylornithine deacetylase/succinyl-diaminopimelate desuccinylase-like protein